MSLFTCIPHTIDVFSQNHWGVVSLRHDGAILAECVLRSLDLIASWGKIKKKKKDSGKQSVALGEP